MDSLMTVEEAAQLSRMSPSWWRQKVFRREIDYLKIGRNVRIRRSTVEGVLNRAEIKARGEKLA